MSWEADQVQAMRGRFPPVGWQNVADAVGGYIEDVRNRYDPARTSIGELEAMDRLVCNLETDLGRPQLMVGSLPTRTLVVLSAVSKASTTELVAALKAKRDGIYNAVERLVGLDFVERLDAGKHLSCRITAKGRQAVREMRG